MYGYLNQMSMFVWQPLNKIQTFYAMALGFLFVMLSMNVFLHRQWDFGVYYMAGYALNHDLNPYDKDGLLTASYELPDVEYGGLPYLYPPITAHLFQPLACLSYFEATYVWYILKCTALEILIVLTLSLCRIPRNLLYLFILHIAALWFRPIHLDFNAGNMAVFEAALIYSFFWLWKTGKTRLSAIPLTLAGSIKVIPFLLILYPLHLRKYKLLVSFSLCAIVLGGLTLLDYERLTSYFSFYRSTKWLMIWDEQVQSFFNCSATTVIVRTFSDTYFAQPIYESALAVSILIPLFPITVFIVTGILISQYLKTYDDRFLDGTVISLLIMTLLLIPPRLAGYTLSWLYLPIICLLKEGITHGKFGVLILISIGLWLLQADIPPEHVSPGITQLLIDKDFFGLLAIYLAGTVFFIKKLKIS